MEKRSRTEITIETDRVFVISKRTTPYPSWCLDCGQPYKMVTPEEAAKANGLTARAVYRAIESSEVHFSEARDGQVLICLNSFSLFINKALATDTCVNRLALAPLVEVDSEPARQRPTWPRIDATISEIIQENAGPGLTANNRARVWGFTPEAFDKLLRCLDADRDTAGYKYESTRRRLIKYFEYRGCTSAEDLADETINRVARKISNGCEIWTSNPASYFYGVARYVLKEYWSSPDRDFSPLESLPTKARPAGKPTSIDVLESEHPMESRLQALDHCIQELSAEDRDTILQYYQGEKRDKIRNRENLARQLEIPLNALRIKVHRIRKRLEAEVYEYLEQQL